MKSFALPLCRRRRRHGVLKNGEALIEIKVVLVHRPKDLLWGGRSAQPADRVNRDPFVGFTGGVGNDFEIRDSATGRGNLEGYFHRSDLGGGRILRELASPDWTEPIFQRLLVSLHC